MSLLQEDIKNKQELLLIRKDVFLKNSRWIQRISNFLFDPGKYYVLNPEPDRVGNLITEIMLGVSIAKKYNKILILLEGYKPVNRDIFKANFNCKSVKRFMIRILFLNSLLVISGMFNRLYNGLRIKIIDYLPSMQKLLPDYAFLPRIGLESGEWGHRRLIGTDYYFDTKIIIDQHPHCGLSDNQILRAEELRDDMGLPSDVWFCCLHVREAGYLLESPDNKHEYRNSEIESYLPAIKSIISKGGYVIRFGDKKMKKLPNIHGLIDYAHSEHRSGLMDLFFIEGCKFYMGCDSGPLAYPLLQNKPILSINHSHVISNWALKESDVVIPKHVFDREKKRFLSFNEVLNKDIYIKADEMDFNGYDIVSNTQEEILETVSEYINFINNKFIRKNNLNIQNQIKKLIKDNYNYYLDQPDVDPRKKESWLCKADFFGYYGDYYLDNCWNYTDYMQKKTKLYLQTK
tara:strand:- start:360 stop:1739 length:1380 start_codon:yes stop_codon:yes gene_type:complete